MHDSADLPDIQKSEDTRGIALDHVGISHLIYPAFLLSKDPTDGQSLVPVTGEFEASVQLPATSRGTHMSRLVQVVDSNVRSNRRITLHFLQDVALDICSKLGATESRIKVKFYYFIPKTAPVSGECGLMNYHCVFTATCKVSPQGPKFDSFMTVEVPSVSLCPCSKEISDYGAHNQRAYVEVTTWNKNPSEFIWIEEIVDLVEASASCPVYPILKRPDERFVTMKAYENPRFVEDIAREVYARLDAHGRVSTFKVRVTSMESIHNHQAFAEVEKTL